MRFSIVVVATAISLALGACVSVPEFREDVLAPSDVAINLKCEIADAISSQESPYFWLQGWKMGATLTLTVFNKANGSGDVSLAVPLSPGTAIPKVAFGLNTEATRTAVITFQEKLKNLAKSDICLAENRSRWPVRLHGDLGIEAWFSRVTHAQRRAELTITQIDYTVDFVVEKSLTPSANWSLIPIGRRTFGANASLDLRARNTHSLKLVLTRDVRTSATEVVIVGDRRISAEERRHLAERIRRLEDDLRGIDQSLIGKRRQSRILDQERTQNPQAFTKESPKYKEATELAKDISDLRKEKSRTKSELERARRELKRGRAQPRTRSTQRDPELDGALTRSILRDIQRDLRLRGIAN